jgi:uncharacterized Zn-finger protein/ribosomal protein L32
VNPPMPPAENLKRWKDSSHPRTWVEAHKGAWNHADWLSLVEELEQSEYWPLNLDAVGQVLEELEQEYKKRQPAPGPPPLPPTIAPEAAEWYFARGGTQNGPVTWAQLRQRAASGQLQPTDMVWKNGMAAWAAAASIQHLFPPAPVATSPPPLPPVALQTTGAKVCEFCHTRTNLAGSANQFAVCPNCGNYWYAHSTCGWVHYGHVNEHRHGKTQPSVSPTPTTVPRPIISPTRGNAAADAGSSETRGSATAPQAPTPQTVDPATYPMAFVDVGSSFKLACPCCSREGHNVVQYENERKEPGWSFWRGSWACPHCGHKFFLWKCKHCRVAFSPCRTRPATLCAAVCHQRGSWDERPNASGISGFLT